MGIERHISTRERGEIEMTTAFDEKRIVELLKRLVETPSPSGYTEKVMELVTKEMDGIGVAHKKTNKGAIIATIEGMETTRHRLLTAHTDTLGAMVKEIKTTIESEREKIKEEFEKTADIEYDDSEEK